MMIHSTDDDSSSMPPLSEYVQRTDCASFLENLTKQVDPRAFPEEDISTVVLLMRYDKFKILGSQRHLRCER